MSEKNIIRIVVALCLTAFAIAVLALHQPASLISDAGLFVFFFALLIGL